MEQIGVMNYKLAYQKEILIGGPNMLRIEIYRVAGSEIILPKQIGDVLTQLSLNIQGQNDDIDSPIIKTSLTIGLIDAPERNTLKEQCGNWEGFYTRNSQEWKVLLIAYDKEDQGSERQIWGGYITPDSYTETLKHHGEVTIIARDNIGQLQDFDFDAIGNADGMITPHEILMQAWAKINSPMTLDFRGEEDSISFMETGGTDALDTYMNVSAFEGKTWYDVLSEVLYAYGLVMRYNGHSVIVCPLRQLPAQGYIDVDNLQHIEPVFRSYATRELMPAVKFIEEIVSYDLQKELEQPHLKAEDFTGTTTPCNVIYKDFITGDSITKSISTWPIKNTLEDVAGWGNQSNGSLFLDPHRFELSSSVDKKVLEQTLLAVCSENRLTWYSAHIDCQDIVLNIQLGNMVDVIYSPAVITNTLNIYTVNSFKCYLKLFANGKEYFYNGKRWIEGAFQSLVLPVEDNAINLDIALSYLDIQGGGLITLGIESIDVAWETNYPYSSGTFLGIKRLAFSLPNTRSLMEKNTVKTVYDEQNNIKMSRTPELGPAYDNVPLPGFIRNGIFREDAERYVPTPLWRWPGGTEELQLAELAHRQLLCFHSKPNNLISGTIVNADVSRYARIWEWKGKEHIMLSGSFNFLTGEIEGAVLREFVRYEDLW